VIDVVRFGTVVARFKREMREMREMRNASSAEQTNAHGNRGMNNEWPESKRQGMCTKGPDKQLESRTETLHDRVHQIAEKALEGRQRLL
jgi:hypothetical protein